tara:strand:+ start:639 stop:821 length:183 start_codon:yes stop_codon:yes gene_type:complete
MLQAMIILMVFVAIIAIIDGVFTGFAIVGTVLNGCFTFIFQGLGILLGIGLAIYMISLLF